jgi:Ca2+-binding RTX toxin-like protein
VNNPAFPTKGVVDGIYLNQNAAALVGRCANALFIAFRGTNDDPSLEHGLTPDDEDWVRMGAYYALFKPFVVATDLYLKRHPEITHVFVTGHSLGGSMVQKYMTDHLGSRYEAITFGNAGYSDSILHPPVPAEYDPRILNIFNPKDPVQRFSPYPVDGDRYELHNYAGNFKGNPGFDQRWHDPQLYYDEARFLSDYHYQIPLLPLINSGHSNAIQLFVNISYDSYDANNGSDPWQMTMPTGRIKGDANHDVIGVTGGGVLTGGSGPDTFVFDAGFGRVTVTDYRPGEDVLQFERALFPNFRSLVSHTASHHGGVVITYDPADTIKLDGITKQVMHEHAGDFHFI